MERVNPDGSKTPLTISNHTKIRASTLRTICTQTGISRDDFIKAYEKTWCSRQKSNNRHTGERRYPEHIEMTGFRITRHSRLCRNSRLSLRTHDSA